MADKKESAIKDANEQRSHINHVTDQEGAKSEVGRMESANTQAANPLEYRFLQGIVLNDRGILL